MSTRKNARRDDVHDIGWEAVDRLVVAARVNGALPSALFEILTSRTEEVGAAAAHIGAAYIESIRAIDAREKLRAAARDAAKDEIADLEAEADALARRRKRAETEELGAGRVIAIAFGLAGLTRPAPDLDVAARDADRLDDLTRRVALLRDALARLDGRGRPQTAAREFAERLVPIWLRLTGEVVTASRSVYGAERFSGFETFFRASVEWLTGARPSPTLTRSVAAAIANSAENPKA